MVNWKTTLFTIVLWQGITRLLELFRIHMKDYTSEKTSVVIEVTALMFAIILVYHLC